MKQEFVSRKKKHTRTQGQHISMLTRTRKRKKTKKKTTFEKKDRRNRNGEKQTTWKILCLPMCAYSTAPALSCCSLRLTIEVSLIFFANAFVAKKIKNREQWRRNRYGETSDLRFLVVRLGVVWKAENNVVCSIHYYGIPWLDTRRLAACLQKKRGQRQIRICILNVWL